MKLTKNLFRFFVIELTALRGLKKSNNYIYFTYINTFNFTNKSKKLNLKEIHS